MKITENDNIESIAQHRNEQQYKILGSLRPKPGHTLFKINHETRKVSEAQMLLAYGAGKGKRVNVEPGCFYISALNKANALKHYLKMLNKSKL